MAEPFLKMKFEGAAELARVLNGLSTAASSRRQLRALRAAAVPMRDEMEHTAPRGEGLHGRHLADSIAIMAVRDKQGTGDKTVAIGPTRNAFWGFFQEHGTIRHGPQPFAAPAFDSQGGRSFQILQVKFWAMLKKAIPRVRV